MSPSTVRIAFASFIGTAIEFYDFYIYGLAVAMVIGPIFFPGSDPAAQALNAFLTFGIAFLARPLGALLFGHFGDKIGRKTTLVASLLVMGVSTTLIGVLPGHDLIGWAAPALLCLLRFGQGIGLGGEWGGAALVATENAPAGKRAWFGMFPQLGAPLGFILANGIFLSLALTLGDDAFRDWGWRIPFLLSVVLLAIGLYVRLALVESPVYQRAMARQERAEVPLLALLRDHWRPTLQGALAMAVCYALFYTATVFALGYGVKTLGVPRAEFLAVECAVIVFMAIGILLSARLADRVGRRPVLIAGSVLAVLSGFLLAPAFASGDLVVIAAFLALELLVMGITFGPMGALLPELFPTRVRYTGAAVSYNLGGILGASFAPLLSQWLVENGGLAYVGGYISAVAVVSLLALLTMRETRDQPLD